MTARLVKNGIPFDVAESWPDHERMAYFVIFAELDGAKFDFDTGQFVKQDS